MQNYLKLKIFKTFFASTRLSRLSRLSRKFKDFELWSIAVKLHKFGYFYESNGRKLLISNASSINKYRYSTNSKGPVSTPTQDEIDKVL